MSRRYCASGPALHLIDHRQAGGLLCKLPKKRRRTEVSAFPNRQHDATGRLNTLNLDLSLLSRVPMAPAFGIRFFRVGVDHLHAKTTEMRLTFALAAADCPIWQVGMPPVETTPIVPTSYMQRAS
jgi:hypothetical protein